MEGIGAVSGGVGVEARSVGDGVERVVAGGVGIEDIIRSVRGNSRRAVIGEVGEIVRRALWSCSVATIEDCPFEEDPRKWGPKLRANARAK
jgi:hypothetical protein